MARLRDFALFPARARAAPILKLLAVSAIALTSANCAKGPQTLASSSSSGSSVDPKYGVKASPRLYNEGDAIPKGGGRRFSGKPYVVAGRTYVPRDEAKGYVREGLASWYGAAFHGRMTANGEVFDRNSIAAAHPTLPLPSYARVTNLRNGHSMIVRVNDRGPYHANRVMDVSEEVAGALDFRRSGTARVRVEYVGKASTAGSDDRKLMATLRTDGEPAAIRGRAPVMMADLGSDVEPEPAPRPARSALAFKPAPERDDEPGEAPAPRPMRVAPVVVASAAGVAVPAALQPTAARPASFKPLSIAPPPRVALSQPGPAPLRPPPLSLAPPPMRLAGSASAKHSAAPAPAPLPVRAARADSQGAKTAPAGRLAALPPSAKLAMAKLATGAAASPPARRARLAEIR